MRLALEGVVKVCLQVKLLSNQLEKGEEYYVEQQVG